MKKLYYIVAVILSFSMLSACASSTSDVSTPEAITEQAVVSEEAPKEAETETEVSADKIVSGPDIEVETDKLTFSFIPDPAAPDGSKFLRFMIDLDKPYNQIESGFLFMSSEGKDGLYDPTWNREFENESTKGSTAFEAVEIEGDTGKEIKHSFEEMYTNSLAADEGFLLDKYDELAREASKLKAKNTGDLLKMTEPLDVSDKVSKKLVYVTSEAETIELPVISASLYPGSVCWSGKDIKVPYWEVDNESYYLYGVSLDLFVPKDSLNVIKEYLTGQIQISEQAKEPDESEAAEDVAEGSSDNGLPIELPDGKNFDNVTGFEGFWYDSKYGFLDYVFFSDGTGWEVSNLDGHISDIKYEVGSSVVIVYGELDIYYNFIIDENTLRDDWDLIRQPYHGGL